MTLRSEIRELARRFDDEDNAAFDLWSWLPTHRRAQKDHGDYAHEYRPPLSIIMEEAAAVFAALRDGPLTPEAEARILEEFPCQCGESHGEEGA